LRRFQLDLVEHGASSATLNATITGLRFFFEVTLGAPERLAKMSPVRELNQWSSASPLPAVEHTR
jgi:integrase/recombinase XerD